MGSDGNGVHHNRRGRCRHVLGGDFSRSRIPALHRGSHPHDCGSSSIHCVGHRLWHVPRPTGVPNHMYHRDVTDSQGGLAAVHEEVR